MRWMPPVLVLLPLALLAGEAKVQAETSPLDQLLEEQKRWSFEPTQRTDTFIDLEELKRLQQKVKQEALKSQPTEMPGRNTNPSQAKEQMLDWGKREVARVEGFLLARKWDDGMKECELAMKNLARFSDDAEVAKVIERLKRYHAQLEEAKTYEEAQVKFDALGLKVEGILWDPQKGSMAVIGGEARARRLNDRVKDCVIINIDTNRVDFLFHHNRRRFEFQRFVGEDVKATK